MTQTNVIELIVKTTDQASSQLKRLQAGIKSMASQVVSLRGAFAGAFVGLGAGIVLSKFIKETVNAQRAAAKLDAAYASMGRNVGVTRAEMDALATTMQRNTVIDDDTIKSAEAILLTFSKVRGEAFGKTIQVAADLSSRMGTDLVGSVRLLGRALEEPIRGMDGLRRSGIVFTGAQKDLIRNLVESGKSGEAVNLMLDTLAQKLGGSAAAEANTLGGAITQLKNSFGDLFEASTETTEAAVESIHDLRDALEDPRFKSAFDKLGAGFASIGAAAVNGISWAADHLQRLFENSEQKFERLNRNVEAARKKGDTRALSAAEGERDRFVIEQESIAKGSADPNVKARAREMRAYVSGAIAKPPMGPVGGAGSGEPSGGRDELTDEQLKGLRQLREELNKQKGALELQAQGTVVSAQALNELSVKTALAKLGLSDLTPALAGVSKELAALNDATVRAAIGALNAEYSKERDNLEAQREALAGNNAALDDLAVSQALAAAGVSDLTQLTDKQREALDRLLGTLKETQAAREALATDQVVKKWQEEAAALELQAEAGWRAADAVAALRQAQELQSSGVTDPAQVARAEQSRQAAAEASRRAQVKELQERLELSRMISSDVEIENELRRIGVERTSQQGQEIVKLVRAQQESRIAVAGIEDAFDSMFASVGDGIKGMLRAFLLSIQKMLAELLSNKLKNALLSQFSVGGGGGNGLFQSFLTTVIGGSFGGGAGAGAGAGASRPPGTIFTAGGGYTRGLTMVGEEGPELLALPGGSRVYNRRQIQFAGAGGGGGINFAPTYNISVVGARNDEQMRNELMTVMTRKSEADKREIFERLHRNGFPRIR